MQNNTKFLYGKRCNLDAFTQLGGPLWFRDIYSLKTLENQLICDDESCKTFCVDSKHVTSLNLNGRDFKLTPNSQVALTQPTRRCHVLCLSNDGNKAELFQRFAADICIEINVELMVEMIKDNTKHFNAEVIGENVDYFKDRELPETIDPMDLVFKKDYEKYSIEKEYRIAIFWPYDHETSLKTESGDYVKVFSAGDDHISLNFKDMNLKELIVNVQGAQGSCTKQT
jgi:hypothetical protein